ncbi:hypothetical protein [Litchfieldia alkalitelluris]|uniref:hypothetical protein n=1 Tax=Litchfieldia alkalitelluris TaxID=304268 RepID=UPI000998A9F2|nr:hypothetical protein [Litchfieldia alkalitelluris]
MKLIVFATLFVLVFSSIYTGSIERLGEHLRQLIHSNNEDITSDFLIKDGENLMFEGVKIVNFAEGIANSTHYVVYAGRTEGEDLYGIVKIFITEPNGEVVDVDYVFDQREAVRILGITGNRIKLSSGANARSRYYDLLERRMVSEFYH